MSDIQDEFVPPSRSLQATPPAAFTPARCFRHQFGLRVLRLSAMPLACTEVLQVVAGREAGWLFAFVVRVAAEQVASARR